VAETDLDLAVSAILSDPKVAKTIRWWRSRRAWGLDWLEQDAVLNRAVHRTAEKHRPRQHVNSSFTRFLIWETDRELAKRWARSSRTPQTAADDLERVEEARPVEPDPDGRAERVWWWADRYLSRDERSALLAVYRDGQSIKQFAANSGVTPEAISARVHSAVARLRTVAEAGGWAHNPEGVTCD
jgi:hypothetical protein